MTRLRQGQTQLVRLHRGTYRFVSRRGTRLGVGHVHRTFYTLSRSTGLREVGVNKGPRLSDHRSPYVFHRIDR